MIPTIGDMTYAELLDSLRKDLLLDATTDVLPNSIIQALMPGTRLSNIIDTAGASPFLQLLSAQKLLLATGQVNGIAVAIGFNNVAVTLATAWAAQHVAFLPFINGAGNLAALSYVGANQTSLTQGGVLLNSTAVTTINVGYVSLGK